MEALAFRLLYLFILQPTDPKTFTNLYQHVSTSSSERVAWLRLWAIRECHVQQEGDRERALQLPIGIVKLSRRR